MDRLHIFSAALSFLEEKFSLFASGEMLVLSGGIIDVPKPQVIE